VVDMSQALMIRDEENDKVIFEFSRNSETYQALKEYIDFPYDKWEDVNKDRLDVAIKGIESEIKELQQRVIFDILKTDNFFEINNLFIQLKEMTVVLGKIYLVSGYVFWNDCWNFCSIFNLFNMIH
jgi:hypothetical protein